MGEDVLKVSIEEKVAVLTLNRPERLNALNRQMAEEAIRRLSEVAVNPEVGAVVITGAGHVSDMAQDEQTRSMEDRVDELRRGQELCWMLHSMPKVTLAAVNGYAMGAGLGIALSCDLRIASSAAKFGTAYAKVGLGGDYGTTWQLTRLVGPAKAKELFFLADAIDASEALRIGLINRMVEQEQFEAAVGEVAKRIANGPLVSYRYMKENVNLAMQSDFRSILDREAMTHIRCFGTEDHREGATAFVEKREAKFRGR
jgi:2-(1,2-epoxy-1,2-dihydrophenyl)acetyl-CoA isomerase